MKIFRNNVKAVSPPEQAGPTHIHNHAPSALAEIFGQVLACFIVIVIGWHAGVFLLGKAGVHHPDEAFAELVLYALGAVAAIIALSYLLDNVLDKVLEHREAMADKATDQLRYRQRMQRSMLADSRRLGEEARLAALVIQIMERAYAYQAKNRRPFRGTWRPWSRRSAGDITLLTLGETKPVGERLAVRAKEFLLEHEGIVDEQLNLHRYPDLASVQRLLLTPVLVRENKDRSPAGWGGGATFPPA